MLPNIGWDGDNQRVLVCAKYLLRRSKAWKLKAMKQYYAKQKDGGKRKVKSVHLKEKPEDRYKSWGGKLIISDSVESECLTFQIPFNDLLNLLSWPKHFKAITLFKVIIFVVEYAIWDEMSLTVEEVDYALNLDLMISIQKLMGFYINPV